MSPDSPWSSYSAYVGKAVAPDWLHSSFVLAMMGQSRRRARYRRFAEAGIDEETAAFFGKKKLSPILGSDAFRERMLSNLKENPEIPETRQAIAPPSLPFIVATVAETFSVPQEAIISGTRGRGKRNPARMAAIYIARKIAGYPLNEIASRFGMTHYASVSGLVTRSQKAIEIDGTLAETIDDTVKIIKVAMHLTQPTTRCGIFSKKRNVFTFKTLWIQMFSYHRKSN